MAHVAGEPLLGPQIGVVLRDSRFVHGRAEIGRVTQILGEGVIEQEGESIAEPPPSVNPPRVIPAPCAVLEPVDAGNGKRVAYDREAGRELGAGEKTDFREWPAGAERAGAGWGIVDQVGALEGGAARTLGTRLEHGFAPQRFLDRKAPLTDVMRRTARISRGKADQGRSDSCRRES